MKLNMQQRRERIRDLSIEARRLHDESKSREWTKDDDAHFNNLTAEIEDLRDQNDREQERLDKLANMEFTEIEDLKISGRSNSSSKDRAAQVFKAFIQGAHHNSRHPEFQAIQAAMSTTTGSEGGFTVATSVAQRFVDSLKGYSSMRRVAEILPTEQGNPLGIVGTDGTAEIGERVPENATASNLDIAFSTRALTAYKYSSKVVAIPFELIMDSVIDIEALVFKRLGQRIGRINNADFTNGTGTAQPFGIVPASTAGKAGATGTSTTFGYDDLVDLQESVDDEYRAIGAGWMMSQAARRILRKIKDTAGRPIWTPGYELGAVAGAPDLLLGEPVTINNDMPAPGASAKSIVYGQLSAYTIRDVMQVQMFRFDDSNYVRLGQIGFLAFSRAGGNLLDTGAVKHFQHSAS